MRLIVAVLDKNGANVTPKVIETLKSCIKASNFGVTSASEAVATKTIELLPQEVSSPIAVGFATTKHNKKPVVMKTEDKTAIFSGSIYKSESNSVLEAITKNPREKTIDAVKSCMHIAEGDFSLIVTEANKLLVARDPLGVEPLYYGENNQIVAVASNRKILWRLGIDSPKSFPPGNIAIVKRGGFTFQPVKVLNYSAPTHITLGDAVDKLKKLLEQSVKLRLKGVQKVAVAFSGGLDSSIVAFLAKKFGADVQLVHVSLDNQPETAYALKAAEELGLPLEVQLFKETDIERVIHEVVWLIEDADPLKVSIGVPFYWIAEKVAEAGFSVLLAGQGADELFGGYKRYVNEYMMGGEENVRKTIYRDVVSIHESNIERDKKICGFHDVELRLPFASYKLADFALSLPVELKFDKKADSFRKIVLRETAQRIGLSEAIVWKHKKAIQYGTGVSSALKRIAKRKKISLAEYIERVFRERM
ncbi:MAG: asparagine synthetase B [Candidatus Bathyarchaeota archaeon]|nr:asparagine synthetase B [Candidatus Bathyarchaeota archaeon]